MRLSDTIEQFIKEILGEEAEGVELRRNELAEYFHCAPSQINYVLSTRFTPAHGYLIDSKRGGGGCIHIVRVSTGPDSRTLEMLLEERIGERISLTDAQMLCSQLLSRNIITQKEAAAALSAISGQALSVPIPETLKDTLRAKILRSVLLTIIHNNQ